MARDLAKRLLIFVIAYLVMSTVLGFFFQEDDLTSVGETLEYEGKKVDIKVYYLEGQEEWASQTLQDAVVAIEGLTDVYGHESPHDSISFYSSTIEDLDNYLFDVEKGSSSIDLASDAERYSTTWAVSLLWMERSDAQLPEWVVWGHATYAAYLALGASEQGPMAQALYDDISSKGASYAGDDALSALTMPDDASSDGGVAAYLVWKSFTLYEGLYDAVPAEIMQDIYDEPFGSQNPSWDSARYVSMVQDKSGGAATDDMFESVFSDSVETELLRRRIFTYLETIGAIMVVTLIFLWAFWGNIKHRFGFISILKERNSAVRALMRKYGSKDRILMELEAYFHRQIPDDDYVKYAKQFYEETMV